MKELKSIIITLLLAIVAWLLWLCFKHYYTQPKVETIEHWDTTYIEKHDTLPVEKVKLIIDYVTIPCPNVGSSIDSVNGELQPDSGMALPVVQKMYSDDSTYTAYVSGVDVACYPKLDSISVRQRTVTHDVIKNTIINNTKPVTIGLQVGAGYGVFSKKPDLWLGVGCQFNF